MTRQAKKKSTRRAIRSPSLGSHSDRSSADDRAQSPPPSDYETFQSSDSSEEDFGENAEDKEWPVKAIVGEEILLNRHKRYQVEWEGWQRPDGTNTTWSDSLPGANRLLCSWIATRKKEKRLQANERDIDLATLDKYMPHNIHTAEDAVAYNKKLGKWAARPVHWDDWVAMDTPAQEEQVTSTSVEASRKRKRPDSHASGSRASSSRMGEDESTLVGSPAPSSKRRSSSTIHRTHSRTRSSIQKQWERSLQGTGAARVTIVNEVDDEEFPPIVRDFEYLENRCNYDIDVPDPSATENKAFIIGCECVGGCNNTLACSCLMESQCIDEYEEETPAYDANGLFLFNNQREVVECNENCSCNRKCNNTVAQRSRKIPMEIFKTRGNGWGVRSPVGISRGTVLGLYTGKIIRREDVASLSEEQREYTFDLDVRDDEPGLERYSVCAYAEGNWTRFVNHSCNPTAKVYSVVFDTAVAANMPYIAFVAAENIPARKEITIDYNPSAARDDVAEAGKKKNKRKARVDETQCVCGSENCRGFI